MKWWNCKKRALGQYYWETGALQITLWGDIETVAALDMAETLIKLKREELVKQNKQ